MTFDHVRHLHEAPTNPRERVERIVQALDSVLPGQAPIQDFVHHNTLHGFQHLPFDQALSEFEQLTGTRAYWPEETFRRQYREQRISDQDIDAELTEDLALQPDTVLIKSESLAIRHRDLYRLAMIFGIEAIPPEQLRWARDETGVLSRIMDDIPPSARHRLLQTVKSQASAQAGQVPGPEAFIGELWEACLEKLEIIQSETTPDAILAEPSNPAFVSDLGVTAADQDPGAFTGGLRSAVADLDATLTQLGEHLSLVGLLKELTGINGLEIIRPELARQAGSFLDEGLAAWHAPDRDSGFYTAWQTTSVWSNDVDELTRFPKDSTPIIEDATDAIVRELERLALPPNRWEAYLRRVAIEIPGWAGIMNWRAHHPSYPANRQAPARLEDFLAVRLILDRRWSDAQCLDHWGIPASLSALQRYFKQHPCEFWIRRALFRGELPEHLAIDAHRAASELNQRHASQNEWRTLARRYQKWLESRHRTNDVCCRANDHGWRLFRLAQHLGLTARDIRAMPRVDAARLLDLLDEFHAGRRVRIWLRAYERHYRDQILSALADKRRYGPARNYGSDGPQVQIVCCMDDREESFRRHLEELDPRIETFGAAGFFGVPMYWRGLDDSRTTPLCPIVVTPSNEVHEIPRADARRQSARRQSRLRIAARLSNLLHHGLRRTALSAGVLIDFLAPAYLMGLLASLLFPARQHQWHAHFVRAAIPAVPTEVAVTARHEDQASISGQPRLGFTDAEQADRVEAFLRNIGLTQGIAPLVVLMGHGSSSENNPHRAAYDCGACSGRHGGPNARVFAAMANRPEVRRRLSERGLRIPETTHFIGAEHDTCDDSIRWFDVDDLPPLSRPVHHALSRILREGCQRSAQERCRRFASAPVAPNPIRALAHVAERSADFSQPRPELGHATNAAAFIGRRSMSEGVFFDRRVFLISYDPEPDPDGKIVEGILLAVGPVGAGINLEYYFSTVASDVLGCGTKVPHNVTGFFGVMEGASSDLRTGLPRQMTEIHEPMRLLVVVEQTHAVLTAIYHRQAPLRELIGNRWIQLVSKDPGDGSLWIFSDQKTFVPWHPTVVSTAPTCRSSDEWFAGKAGPLPPARIVPGMESRTGFS